MIYGLSILSFGLCVCILLQERRILHLEREVHTTTRRFRNARWRQMFGAESDGEEVGL